MSTTRPTPTNLRIIKGNPSRRPFNLKEPQPSVEVVQKPEDIKQNKFASEIWDRLADKLINMRVMSVVDWDCFVRLCMCYAQIKELELDIATNGYVLKYTNDDENNGSRIIIKANPAVSHLSDADKRFKNYLCEFGLTPASRTKIQVLDEKKIDEKERLFK